MDGGLLGLTPNLNPGPSGDKIEPADFKDRERAINFRYCEFFYFLLSIKLLNKQRFSLMSSSAVYRSLDTGKQWCSLTNKCFRTGLGITNLDQKVNDLIIILQLVFTKKLQSGYFGNLFIFIKNNSINYARFLFS